MKPSAIATLALGLLLSSASARAEEPGPNQLGAELMFGQMEILNDQTLIGIALHGQFELSPQAGLFARLPVAHVSNDIDSATSLGNATLGMNYLLTSHARAKSWIDGSLSLPTAADDGEEAVAAGLFGLFWAPDPGLYLPDVTTLRARYNHRFRQASGNGLLLSAGFQYLSVNDGDDDLRIPLAIGGNVQLSPKADFIGRFTTIVDLDADEDDDDFFHTLELGVSLFGNGTSRAEILLYLPLDDFYRDNLEAWGLRGGFTTYL